MPTGHFKRTQAHCEAISRAMKGKNKGARPEWVKQKIARTLKGRKFSKSHRAKLRLAMLGKKRAPFSKAWKEKLTQILRQHQPTKRKPSWNRKLSETRKRSGVAKGSKNPNWQGGLTSLQAQLRNSDEYKAWRRAVYQRDGYRCVKCGVRGNGKNLQAHHKVPFCILMRRQQWEKLWDVSNGETHCLKCHKKTDTYGWKAWNLLKRK